MTCSVRRDSSTLAAGETRPLGPAAPRRGGSPLETLVRLWPAPSTVSLPTPNAPCPAWSEHSPALTTHLVGRGPSWSGSVSEVRRPARPAVPAGPMTATCGWPQRPDPSGSTASSIRVGATTTLLLAISSAGDTSLAQLTLREPVGRALDLGTGCGVQALHLSGHADEVVATDVNPRALAVTAFNAALNDVRVDVRDGSLWEPVADQRFDLVTTNPPFVISPATTERLVYRDSGLPGDRVVEDIVRGARRRSLDGRAGARSWRTGRSRAPTGRGLAAGGWLDPRLRRARRPARGARPAVVRRAVAARRRPAPAAPATSGVRRVAGLVRARGHRGHRLRLGQPPPRRLGPGAARMAARDRAADRACDS